MKTIGKSAIVLGLASFVLAGFVFTATAKNSANKIRVYNNVTAGTINCGSKTIINTTINGIAYTINISTAISRSTVQISLRVTISKFGEESILSIPLLSIPQKFATIRSKGWDQPSKALLLALLIQGMKCLPSRPLIGV